jgi:hypothetical protein
MKLNTFVKIVCPFVLVGLMSGCAQLGKVTGGGWMESASGSGKANFGFNANSCDAYELEDEWVDVRGRFNYHDKNADIKMNGKVVSVMECLAPAENLLDAPLCDVFCIGGYVVEVDYRSTLTTNKGSGSARVCVWDNGEGANATASDFAKFEALTGPFAGYMNSGPVQGNIKAHECEEEEI